jgi:hypothetical protein
MPAQLKTVDGRECEFVNNPQKIILPQSLPPFSALRRII